MRCVVIIPAYNEEKTIADVVIAAARCPLVAEVVVVSDGSKDKTVVRAKAAGATVVNLTKNRGKGGAMQAGIQSVRGDVYLFLDGDLLGLTPLHVAALLNPILAGECEATLGIFGKGRMATDLAQKIAPFLSGQRAITAVRLAELPDFSTAGWGVEVLLTKHLQTAKIPVVHVLLEDVTHVMKEEKRGLVSGIASRLRMYWHILRVLSPTRRPNDDR